MNTTTTTDGLINNHPKPCETCGTCPACGRGGYYTNPPGYNPWGFNPWINPYYPWINPWPYNTAQPIWIVDQQSLPTYSDPSPYVYGSASITIS